MKGWAEQLNGFNCLENSWGHNNFFLSQLVGSETRSRPLSLILFFFSFVHNGHFPVCQHWCQHVWLIRSRQSQLCWLRCSFDRQRRDEAALWKLLGCRSAGVTGQCLSLCVAATSEELLSLFAVFLLQWLLLFREKKKKSWVFFVEKWSHRCTRTALSVISTQSCSVVFFCFFGLYELVCVRVHGRGEACTAQIFFFFQRDLQINYETDTDGFNLVSCVRVWAAGGAAGLSQVGEGNAAQLEVWLCTFGMRLQLKHSGAGAWKWNKDCC